MLATLIAAALSVAPIAVPFVPQTEALCGGAAAAMVFRYWGDAHADAQQFAPLVERRPHAGTGIADDVLIGAIRARGWRVERTDGSLAALTSRLAAAQPVIVLLADRRDRYHYVVVVGAGEDDIVLHDPSWGPSRTMVIAEFLRLWSASKNWSAVVLPSENRVSTTAAAVTAELGAPLATADACQDALDLAIDRIREQGLNHADEILGPLRSRCPQSAGPVRELAGVRFGQRRWTEATSLAREALERQPDDSYALDLLGASLFMQDDTAGALRAWNQLGKPRLDLVRIEGIRRSRYQAIAEAIALKPNALLTADALAQATHRLDELPDRSSARLTVRPDGDGFATVDVAIAERSLPRGWAEWTGTAARTAIDREAAFDIPGFTGQGELWSASWRWWNNRPRVALAFEAPRVGGLPGVWRVEGGWEAETYSLNGTLVREARASGRLTVSDWLTGRVRYALQTGFDSWNDRRRAAALGGSIERRWLDDRVSIGADGTWWIPIASGARFTAFGARSTLRSSITPQRWVHQATFGTERVSDSAPLTIWPGAGDGRARMPLLRAHPLLDGGIIDISSRTAFGRTIEYASVETQRWLDRPQVTRLGVAAFVDAARSSRSFTPDGATHADAGLGLRIRLPGATRVLRVDAAWGLRDRSRAITIGWTF